jgi:hypothetical protein
MTKKTTKKLGNREPLWIISDEISDEIYGQSEPSALNAAQDVLRALDQHGYVIRKKRQS